MKSNPTITNLKEFVDFYSEYKSDFELANLLDISIDDIQSVKDPLTLSQSNNITLL